MRALERFAVLAILAVPAALFAVAPAAPHDSQTEDQDPDSPKGTHAVRGVVKSIAPMLLVITRSTRHPSEMALVLTESTLRTGTIVVGSEVSVRYRIEGHTLVAAAVVVNHRHHSPHEAA
jgi:hypothetical protein